MKRTYKSIIFGLFLAGVISLLAFIIFVFILNFEFDFYKSISYPYMKSVSLERQVKYEIFIESSNPNRRNVSIGYHQILIRDNESKKPVELITNKSPSTDIPSDISYIGYIVPQLTAKYSIEVNWTDKDTMVIFDGTSDTSTRRSMIFIINVVIFVIGNFIGRKYLFK